MKRPRKPRPDASAPGDGAKRSVGLPDHAALAAYIQAAGETDAPQPTLYLHGAADGCMGLDIIGPVTDHLAPGSELVVIEGAGHFLHLERPDEVNDHVLRFLTS